MGEPHGKIPGLPVNVAVSVIDHGDLNVGVAVGGGNLGDHRLGDSDGRLPVVVAGDAQQAVLQEVHRHRHILEHLEIVVNNLGFICQGVVHHGEALLGDGDLRLKRDLPHAQPNAEEIVIAHIPVPQQGVVLVKGAALLRADVALLEGAGVLLVGLLDLVPHSEEILAVTLKAAVLLLLAGLPHIADVQKRPDGADHRRGKRNNHAHIHKRPGGPAAAAAGPDRDSAAQQHRNGHGQRRADGHGQRRVPVLRRVGRSLDFEGISVELAQIPWGAVEEDLIAALGAGGRGQSLNAFLQRLERHAQSVALVDGNHVAKVDYIQAHDPDAVTVIQDRVAVYSSEIEICTVFGGVAQAGLAALYDNLTVLAGDKVIGILNIIFGISPDFNPLKPGQGIFPIDREGVGQFKADDGNATALPGLHLKAEAIVYRDEIGPLALLPSQEQCVLRLQGPPVLLLLQGQADVLVQSEQFLLEYYLQQLLPPLRKSHLAEPFLAVDRQYHTHPLYLYPSFNVKKGL